MLFFVGSANAQQYLKGVIVENDSITPMPFVYLINRSTGAGTMSDNNGKFSMVLKSNDTILCTYVGYLKVRIAVNDMQKLPNGDYKVVMIPLPINLKPVVVTTFKYKPYEREYMKDIIDKSKIRPINAISSPITALYMKFSREGKQINKLAKIFEDILIEEQVQQRLSPEILRKLTGDETIDYEAFRKYCYTCSNYYIINAPIIEVYNKVMDCYKRWKFEKRSGY